jgi:alpha-galactosidase
MTLWSMARSPLITGTNLTRMDTATETLFENPEVIAVDQHSRENRQFLRSGSLVVWTAVPESGVGHYVAVFNLGDAAQGFHFAWKDLGLAESSHALRDLWARKDLGAADSLKGSLAPHAAMLYRVH